MGNNLVALCIEDLLSNMDKKVRKKLSVPIRILGRTLEIRGMVMVITRIVSTSKQRVELTRCKGNNSLLCNLYSKDQHPF